jgi:hypothetical protein
MWLPATKQRTKVTYVTLSGRVGFPPPVVAVVMPVVFCSKANEKSNKNTKISCL